MTRGHVLAREFIAKVAETDGEFAAAARQTLKAIDKAKPKSITCADDVYELVGPKYAAMEVEYFGAILLNTKNRVIDVIEVSKGGIDGTLAAPRDVYREAVRRAVSAVIVFHNHPSGDPEPSPDDRSLTRRLAEAGEIVGIRFLDHVVVGSDGFVSMKDRGLF